MAGKSTKIPFLRLTAPTLFRYDIRDKKVPIKGKTTQDFGGFEKTSQNAVQPLRWGERDADFHGIAHSFGRIPRLWAALREGVKVGVKKISFLRAGAGGCAKSARSAIIHYAGPKAPSGGWPEIDPI